MYLLQIISLTIELENVLKFMKRKRYSKLSFIFTLLFSVFILTPVYQFLDVLTSSGTEVIFFFTM